MVEDAAAMVEDAATRVEDAATNMSMVVADGSATHNPAQRRPFPVRHAHSPLVARVLHDSLALTRCHTRRGFPVRHAHNETAPGSMAQ